MGSKELNHAAAGNLKNGGRGVKKRVLTTEHTRTTFSGECPHPWIEIHYKLWKVWLAFWKSVYCIKVLKRSLSIYSVSHVSKFKNCLFNPNTIKSYKNYLQNMQHMVLRNRPTLIIGTERLACLNSPPGVQRGTLA